MISVVSSSGFSETLARLLDAIVRRGLTVFAQIDHAAAAREVGMDLADEVVVVFGNPRAGTPLMQDDPEVGIELPLRVLVWDRGGETVVGYNDPRSLADVYNLMAQARTLDAMSALLRALADDAAAESRPGGTEALAADGGRVAATASESAGILQVRDLTVAYGPKTAVDAVSFEIRRGEIFGLLGPNGAGKTSTLSAIEGLVKPSSGTVLLDGIDSRRQPTRAKARMGVSLQATSFQSELRIAQIVRLYAGLYGVELSDSQIAEGLGEIGLGGEAQKAFKQLSGGQQQRLALHIAVIHDPALLLLDEPTAGLDPQSRRQLWGRIEHIRQEGGSILLTTHSMEEAQAVCDRVAIIDNGTLLTTAAPRELIEKHKHDPRVQAVAHGEVTLEDVFIGLTGSEIRD